jgi:hypothetical protein
MLWKASEYSSALRTLPSRQVGHRPAHNTYLTCHVSRDTVGPSISSSTEPASKREKDIAPASYLTNLRPGKRRSNAEF